MSTLTPDDHIEYTDPTPDDATIDAMAEIVLRWHEDDAFLEDCTAPVQVVTDHAGASFTGSLSHSSAQVDNASVCRFLTHLRKSITKDDYVSSYAADVISARAIILDGVWSTEELRAAILAALGQK